MTNRHQPGEPSPDERKTGLFLGGEMEISPPPDIPPQVPTATPRPSTRAPSPSRQLPIARGSSTRPTIRHDQPPRAGMDDTTKIVACIALGLAALGIVALLMMGGRAPVRVAEPKPVPPPTTPAPIAPERPLPANTVTRPQPPPPRTTTTNPTNLASNPSFELLVDGKPVDWHQQTYTGEPVFSVTPNGRRGKNSVCISSTTGADAKWFLRFTTKPNTTYLMKGWAKCENITGPGRGALFNMEPNDFHSDEIKGTTDWKMLQFTFESRDKTEVYLNCLYGGWGNSTGTAWFDDIEVIELFSSK